MEIGTLAQRLRTLLFLPRSQSQSPASTRWPSGNCNSISNGSKPFSDICEHCRPVMYRHSSRQNTNTNNIKIK